MVWWFFSKAGIAVIWLGAIVWSQGVWAQPPIATDGGTLGSQTTPMTDIHDIKPLSSILFPGSISGSVWYLLAGLLLAALLVAAYRYWRNKKRPQDIFPAEVILPPEVVAIQALDALAADREIADKAFYFRLSTILRAYLSGRFGVDGLEMTTEELLPAVERLGIDRSLKSGIRDFLLFSDPVKFADVSAPGTRRNGDLEFVSGFVKRTTPNSTEDETTGAKEPLTPVAAGKSIA
jgi:hypothetical protein